MKDSISSHSTSNDVQPAPGSEGKLDLLKILLREMFQLDRGDLDFGLYRIMNLKTAEITDTVIVFDAPDQMVADWVEMNYTGLLKTTLKTAGIFDRSIAI